jgi:nitrogen fixation protein FixH
MKLDAGHRWILIVIGLLAGNVLAVVILITAAGPASADRVLPRYYERAAEFDGLLAEEAASTALGWTARTTIAGTGVEIRLVDGAGAPIAGARVDVTGFHRAHAGAAVELALGEDAAGVYRAELPAARPGWWELTVRGTRGHDGFVSRVAVEAR